MKKIFVAIAIAAASWAIYSIVNQEIGINQYKEFSNTVLHSNCNPAIEEFNDLILKNDGKITTFDKSSINSILYECSYSSMKKTLIKNAQNPQKHNPYL